MAERRIKQHHTIAQGLLLLKPKISDEIIPGSPLRGGVKCRWGGLKSATFDKLPAISQKRYKIDAWFLLKSNRKSYALYRMVTLPMTLSEPYKCPELPEFVHFCTASHIFVMSVVRNFKFATLTYNGKSHPADEKYSPKGAWSGSGDPF